MQGPIGGVDGRWARHEQKKFAAAPARLTGRGIIVPLGLTVQRQRLDIDP